MKLNLSTEAQATLARVRLETKSVCLHCEGDDLEPCICVPRYLLLKLISELRAECERLQGKVDLLAARSPVCELAYDLWHVVSIAGPDTIAKLEAGYVEQLKECALQVFKDDQDLLRAEAARVIAEMEEKK